MKSVLKDAEYLKGTGIYSDLRAAAEYMGAYRKGMITAGSLDIMKLLRPCVDLRETDAGLGRRAAEALRDFCLEVDRYEPVDRHLWTTLGQLLEENPFSLLDQYDVAAIREENGFGGNGVLEVWDYLYLTKKGLWPRMSDPPLYAAAHDYIRRGGRARFAVRRWLVEDVGRVFGDRPEPTFGAAEVLSFRPLPEIRFRPGAEPAEPYRRGQRVKLCLTDEQGMDFLPEIRILSDRRCGDGREARALGWYHNDSWLLRILYDPKRPEEARVRRYILYPLEFGGFHVLAFAVLDGNYRREKPLAAGDAVRVKLMDLWGRDVVLRGNVTELAGNTIDFRAVFPDGRERGVSVYLASGAADCLRDVAVVERWEQYPLPVWALKDRRP